MKRNRLFHLLRRGALGLLIVAASAQSQVPQIINYQGQLIDRATNKPFNGTAVKLDIAIANGKGPWNETLSNVPVANGVFQVLLGSQTPIPLDIFNVPANRQVQLVVTTTTPDGRTLTSSQPIASVPFAFRSAGAGVINTARTLVAEMGLDNNQGVVKIWGKSPTQPAVLVSTESDGSGKLEITTVTNNSKGKASLAIGQASLGGELNLVDSNGQTVLTAAAQPGNGIVRVQNGANPDVGATMGAVPASGFLSITRVNNGNRIEAVRMTTNSAGGGSVSVNTKDGNIAALLSAIPLTQNGPQVGNVQINNSTGQVRGILSITGDNAGGLLTRTAGGRDAVEIKTVPAGNDQAGYIAVKNTGGQNVVELKGSEKGSSAGFVSVNNAAGAGTISLDGASGEVRCVTIFGKCNNFQMAHPLDPNKEIYYASLEGPEAGVYVRGTGQLVNGKAKIQLPEHFSLVAAEKGMTVQLTPNAVASEGLAVIGKSTRKIVVQELNNGAGAYEFDYMVYAVRKGYENFQIVRDKAVSAEVSAAASPAGSREASENAAPAAASNASKTTVTSPKIN